MKLIQDNYYKATDGFTFRHKESQKIYGRDLYLGSNDSIDNYEEVVYDESTKTDYDREMEEEARRGY